MESPTTWIDVSTGHLKRLMEKVMHSPSWKTLLLYLDNIVVLGHDLRTHMSRLKELLQRLQLAGLKLKSSKCTLLRQEVKFLGHVVSSHGVATNPTKVDTVTAWPTPRNLKDLWTFPWTSIPIGHRS